MKIVLVTNIPTPYRNPVYDLLSKYKNIDFNVIYCSNIEYNRSWKLNLTELKHKYMILSKKKNLRHFNFNIFKILNHKQPDIVITSGFNITMLVAFFWTFLNKKKHIPFTDGTIDSEKKLTFLHKIARVIVYKKSFSFLNASNNKFVKLEELKSPSI